MKMHGDLLGLHLAHQMVHFIIPVDLCQVFPAGKEKKSPNFVGDKTNILAIAAMWNNRLLLKVH